MGEDERMKGNSSNHTVWIELNIEERYVVKEELDRMLDNAEGRKRAVIRTVLKKLGLDSRPRP
jgi:hypothetical protein